MPSKKKPTKSTTTRTATRSTPDAVSSSPRYFTIVGLLVLSVVLAGGLFVGVPGRLVEEGCRALGVRGGDVEGVLAAHASARSYVGLVDVPTVAPEVLRQQQRLERYPQLVAERRGEGERQAHFKAVRDAKDSPGRLQYLAAIMNDYEEGEAFLRQKSTLPHPDTVACGRRGMHESMRCDGVVDCCDARDETDCDYPAGTATRAVPPCDVFLTDQLQTHLSHIDDHIESLEQKNAMLAEGTVLWDDYRAHISSAQQDFAQRYEQFQTLAADPKNDQAQIAHYYQRLSMESERLKQMASFTADDFGPHFTMMPLLGRCLSLADNEKYTKGGSAEPVAHDFNYTICPFDKAVQVELPEGELAKGRAATDDSDDFEEETQQEEEEPKRPVLLGMYQRWAKQDLPATDGFKVRGKRVQVFTGGAPCYEGPERVVLLSVECGVRTKLQSVFENGKCRYEMVISTPLACSHKALYRMQERAMGHLLEMERILAE